MDPNVLRGLRCNPGPDLMDACGKCLVMDIKGHNTAAAWPLLAQSMAVTEDVYVRSLIYRLLEKNSETAEINMMCINAVLKDAMNPNHMQAKVLAALYCLGRQNVDHHHFSGDTTIFVRLLAADAGTYTNAISDLDSLVSARGIAKRMQELLRQPDNFSTNEITELSKYLQTVDLHNLDFEVAYRLLCLLRHYRFSSSRRDWWLQQIRHGLDSVCDVVAIAACSAGIGEKELAPVIATTLLRLICQHDDFSHMYRAAIQLIPQVTALLGDDQTGLIDHLCSVMYTKGRVVALYQSHSVRLESLPVCKWLMLTIQDNLMCHRYVAETICIIYHITDALRPEWITQLVKLILAFQPKLAYGNLLLRMLKALALPPNQLLKEFSESPFVFKQALCTLLRPTPERLATLMEPPETCQGSVERLAILASFVPREELQDQVVRRWRCDRVVSELKSGNFPWDDFIKLTRLDSSNTAHQCFLEKAANPPPSSNDDRVKGIVHMLDQPVAHSCQQTRSTEAKMDAVKEIGSLKLKLERDLDAFFADL